ncbi:interaptin [Legionella jamestowniensis]|uniref:Interaptin n=1 Tax=Legionella jamestowniensis TaxID=455 RepID=A0A0W0UHU0_9GAMM|nr:interaptin [Legionella jamestowniensis]
MNESHADEVSRLEAELKKAGESGDEQVRVVREELEQTQKRHEEVLNKLNQSLKEAMKDTEEVRSKLEVAEQTLASNLASLKELQEQFQVLKRSNEALTEELSSAKASAEGQELKNTELVDEIQRLTEALQSKAEALDSLSSELKKQQETVSDLQQSLSTTQKSFEEAERRSSALEKQLEQLNVKHSKEKIDLETKLSTATEKVDAVQKQLEEEQRKSLESEKKQKEAEKIAEEALKEVAAMRLESKRLQEEMEKLRRETKERQSQLDAREHQLEERANQLNTRESLLEQREMQLEARENELEEHRREVALAEEEVHPRETDLVELLPIIENPREVARRRAITALNAQLANSFDDALLITISEAESNEDLAKAGLKLKYLRALNADDFELIADTAENRLTELQELRSENKKKLLGNNYKIVLGENREKLRGIHTNLNKIATLDSGTRKELDYLVRVSPLHWFSPAFQASLKKNARDLAPHYERLAEGCDVIVDYLKPLSIELKHQLNSLPSMEQMQRLPENSPQRLEIEDRRALLTRYLQRVQKELDLYEPLYKLLNGDPTASNPLLRQGIRKTLRYAQDEKYALKFLDFATDYHDFAQSEKAAHFENDYEADSEAEATVLSGNLGSSRYSVIEAVKHGYFREHVVNPDDPLCGYFIEERAKSLDNRLDKRSLKGYRPQITITVSKFPQGDNHDPAVIAARVKYSLAVATQFLAEFVEPPSEANPLTLRGPNPEELRYLWTALVLVGKEVPEFQFSHKAVEVASAAFMPKKEREAAGFWGRATQWTANSCYNTCFKGQPSLDLWLTGLKEASKHRTHFKKESEQIKKVVGEVTHTFFGNPKAKTIIDELKQEIKADPKAGG